MKLQTQIPLQEQEKGNQIDYNSKLLLLGSCFAENIAEKFQYFKFQSVLNPFGILFHPKAIENLIVNAVKKKKYDANDVFFYNEQWHCYDAHSKLSSTSKKSLLQELNKGLELANKQICESTHIVITLGTSWVYDLVETEKVVANCHKVPQKEFNKRLLSVSEVSKSLEGILNAIHSVNKKASVVFTVSPIRHIKDGFIENTQSKSHLITAVHQFLNKQLNIEKPQLFYFPSYEIMLDELRDYRFYNSDMIHPSGTAIEYIWQRFCKVWIGDKSVDTMKQVDEVQKGLAHKPFNPKSEAHLQFLQKLEVKCERLRTQYPHIVF